ncbi:MAG TPA: hypothetical protein VKO20_06960, partial [Desulfosalsimonadaceae bacterium]|nr:hypothetical protein [Desulfosalsimonadaceae bacterium]
AFRHYCLLADVLEDKQPQKQGLAAYWAAMARLRSGRTDRARLALWDIEEKFANTEAAYRARLKLMDLDRLGGGPRSWRGFFRNTGRSGITAPAGRSGRKPFSSRFLPAIWQGKSCGR